MIEENQRILSTAGWRSVDELAYFPNTIKVLNSAGIWVNFQEVIPKPISNIITVELANGNSLECTHTQEILTTEGWVQAGELTTEHLVKSSWPNEPSQFLKRILHGFFRVYELKGSEFIAEGICVRGA